MSGQTKTGRNRIARARPVRQSRQQEKSSHAINPTIIANVAVRTARQSVEVALNRAALTQQLRLSLAAASRLAESSTSMEKNRNGRSEKASLVANTKKTGEDAIRRVMTAAAVRPSTRRNHS